MNKRKGFTLMVAIITTSLLLVVSFVVVNIAFKQLIISDANEESQYAFYNADSGVECAIFWDLKHTGTTTNPFNPSTRGNISCAGVNIPISSITQTSYTYHSNLNAYVATSTFTYNLTKGCAKVEVVKNQTAQTTKVNSRGYNNCTLGALRRFERGITMSFPSGQAIPVNVIWQNSVGVTPSGNNLTKTGGSNGLWDAGAISSQAIESGDGYVEFTTGEADKYKMAGLADGDSSQHFNDIRFAIFIRNDTWIQIYESGSSLPTLWSYVPGDIFRVAIESGKVRYYKNGTFLYESLNPPVYPMRLDTSFWSTGATLNNAIIAS